MFQGDLNIITVNCIASHHFDKTMSYRVSFLTGALLNSPSTNLFTISGREIMSQFTWDLVLKRV